MAAVRQTRRPKGRGQDQGKSGAGMGVDVFGGPVIDPTENVLSLVDVQTEHADKLRQTDRDHEKDLRDAESRYQDGMRAADNERQRDLANLKERYDKQISDILTVQVKTTSELISTQLDKVTTSLSNQISAATVTQVGLITTLSERIGRLEQNQWQTAGKTSVSDPATADALTRMSNSISALSTTTTDAMSRIANANAEAITKLTAGIAALKEVGGETRGRGMGRGEVFAWLCAAVVAGGGIATLIGFLIRLAR